MTTISQVSDPQYYSYIDHFVGYRAGRHLAYINDERLIPVRIDSTDERTYNAAILVFLDASAFKKLKVERLQNERVLALCVFAAKNRLTALYFFKDTKEKLDRLSVTKYLAVDSNYKILGLINEHNLINILHQIPYDDLIKDSLETMKRSESPREKALAKAPPQVVDMNTKTRCILS